MSDWRDEMQRGYREGAPAARWAFRKAILWLMGIGAVSVLILGPFGLLTGWCSDGQQLLRRELSPTAIQRKYEWFKDASAQLDAKSTAIQVNRDAIAALKADYGADMASWPRDVRQDLAMTRAELRGTILSYNLLQAEYNSQSSKWNWQYFEGRSPLKQNYERMKEGD